MITKKPIKNNTAKKLEALKKYEKGKMSAKSVLKKFGMELPEIQ